MQARLALRILGEIMGWPDAKAQEEFRWLSLMARLKYDAYEDFRAGARFIESFLTWLQQFTPADRQFMYDLLRRRLIYIGGDEIQRLVDLFYPRTLERRLLREIAKRMDIPTYKVWTTPLASQEFKKHLRKTLIMALSDGARIDQLRRATYGVLSNEQFVGMTQVDDEKWKDVLENLRKELGDPAAKFSHLVLVDDFLGTGSTVLREEGGEWKGRLPRFRQTLDGVPGGEAAIFETGWSLQVHHYVAIPKSIQAVEKRTAKAGEVLGTTKWFRSVDFTYELGLGEELSLETDKQFVALSEKYYNSSIETDSTRKGGYDRMNLGYGKCALPVVMGHNTPNNSVALLWYECEPRVHEGKDEPEMRPLFRRRQRHLT